MRLKPIEKPKSILMKLAYRWSKKNFGKVISPMKVIYARKPGLMSVAFKINHIKEKHISLSSQLRYLVQAYTSLLNGCNFCSDLVLATAFQKQLGMEKFKDLQKFRDSAYFDEGERAMLAYVEEATKNKTVSEETFQDFSQHFSEEEMVEVTWLIATENYYNTLTIPFGIESDNILNLFEKKA